MDSYTADLSHADLAHSDRQNTPPSSPRHAPREVQHPQVRYRLNRAVPRFRGRFAHTRFRVAVHALTVRALTQREICALSGLGKHQVQDLLAELRSLEALSEEGHIELDISPYGWAGWRHASDFERPKFKVMASLRRWLMEPYRALSRSHHASTSHWMSSVNGD